MKYKNIEVTALNDGKPHLCRITVVNEKESHIEWLEPVTEHSQEELWNELRPLVEDGKLLELSSKYHLIKK